MNNNDIITIGLIIDPNQPSKPVKMKQSEAVKLDSVIKGWKDVSSKFLREMDKLSTIKEDDSDAKLSFK